MLIVYSTHGSPGASTTALHMGAYWASIGREVLLIEADPAGGSLSHNLGIQFTPGSASFIASGLPPESRNLVDHSQDVLYENLHVMPAPSSPSGARGICDNLANHAFALREISATEMAVIVDGGRINADTPNRPLTKAAAGIAVVSRATSQLSGLENVQEALDSDPDGPGPHGFAVTVGRSTLGPSEWIDQYGLAFTGSIEQLSDMASDLSAFLARTKRKSKKWRTSLEAVAEALYSLAQPPVSVPAPAAPHAETAAAIEGESASHDAVSGGGDAAVEESSEPAAPPAPADPAPSASQPDVGAPQATGAAPPSQPAARPDAAQPAEPDAPQPAEPAASQPPLMMPAASAPYELPPQAAPVTAPLAGDYPRLPREYAPPAAPSAPAAAPSDPYAGHAGHLPSAQPPVTYAEYEAAQAQQPGAAEPSTTSHFLPPRDAMPAAGASPPDQRTYQQGFAPPDAFENPPSFSQTPRPPTPGGSLGFAPPPPPPGQTPPQDPAAYAQPPYPTPAPQRTAVGQPPPFGQAPPSQPKPLPAMPLPGSAFVQPEAQGQPPPWAQPGPLYPTQQQPETGYPGASYPDPQQQPPAPGQPGAPQAPPWAQPPYAAPTQPGSSQPGSPQAPSAPAGIGQPPQDSGAEQPGSLAPTGSFRDLANKLHHLRPPDRPA